MACGLGVFPVDGEGGITIGDFNADEDETDGFVPFGGGVCIDFSPPFGLARPPGPLLPPVVSVFLSNEDDTTPGGDNEWSTGLLFVLIVLMLLLFVFNIPVPFVNRCTTSNFVGSGLAVTEIVTAVGTLPLLVFVLSVLLNDGGKVYSIVKRQFMHQSCNVCNVAFGKTRGERCCTTVGGTSFGVVSEPLGTVPGLEPFIVVLVPPPPPPGGDEVDTDTVLPGLWPLFGGVCWDMGLLFSPSVVARIRLSSTVNKAIPPNLPLNSCAIAIIATG